LVYKNVHKKKSKWWTHPYITKNTNRRAFRAAQELKKNLILLQNV
jgi:hypothetical protein